MRALVHQNIVLGPFCHHRVVVTAGLAWAGCLLSSCDGEHADDQCCCFSLGTSSSILKDYMES